MLSKIFDIFGVGVDNIWLKNESKKGGGLKAFYT